MSKKVTIALSAVALALSLGLTGCGGSSSGDGSGAPAAESGQAASTGDVWRISAETDDFGDEVEGGTGHLTQIFTGTFSNTATAESEFAGGVNILWDNASMDYTVRFAIMDYGDNPMTYTSSSGMILKTKGSDGNIREYALEGTPPNGALKYDYANRLVFDLLNEPDTVRCIIEVESSRYEFELNCANFREVFAENRKDVLKLIDEGNQNLVIDGVDMSDYTSKSDDEALERIMPGKYSFERMCAAWYLVAHTYDYESLTKEEMEDIFPGRFGLAELNGINNNTNIPIAWEDITLVDMTSTNWTCIGDIEADDNKAQFVTATGSGKNEIGDGVFIQDGYVYDMRKIKDGYYIWRVIDTPNGMGPNTFSTYLLLYECDAEGNPTK